MCLFCLLETTSLNKFMKSLPKSEYWHFKICCTWSLAEILGNVLAALTLRSSLRSYLKSASFWPQRFWDLAKNINKILRSRRGSRWESRQVFGHWDFKISLSSRRESRRDFEISPSFWPQRFWDLAEIQQSRQPKTRRDLSQNFAGVNLHPKTSLTT